jgi:D-alanine transaminase
MDIAYLNGKFLPKDEIKISPDDRGFLFADGIYEVVRWYQGFFYDMENHFIRLKRSMEALRIKWTDEDSFSSVANELIKLNGLEHQHALVYFQVTRGAAPRSHNFPFPAVNPTAYGFAKSFIPDIDAIENGISVMVKKEIRWSRCDIKSIALLPNTLSYQEAFEQGNSECIFVRDGLITEGSHSNIFLITDGIIFTHPESEHILSGITRKNVLRIARESGVRVSETAVPETLIENINEAFLTNTGAEVTPITKLGKWKVGDGHPGPVTKLIIQKFKAEIDILKGS